MKAPCAQACLAGGDPCVWLNLAEQGKFKEAWKEMVKFNPLPAVIGKVCPHPCEHVCKRGLLDEPISINALEGYLGEMAITKGWRLPKYGSKTKSFNVAVIGSGPAGLSCAYQLARRNYSVVLWERLPLLGGMLRMGIPDFRLPKDILDQEIENIISLGIGLEECPEIDSEFLCGLKKNYNAIVFATGLQKPKKLNIPGEDNPKVFYGLDFLESCNLGPRFELGKKVIIIGGGNTAIDVARTVRKLGSEAVIFYRRSKAEMPAIRSEVEIAQAEGVEIIERAVPLKILDGLTLEFKGEYATFQVFADNIIIAIGEEKEELPGVKEDGQIFIVRDTGTVAGAIKHGREVAERITKALQLPNSKTKPVINDLEFYRTPQCRYPLKTEAKRCLGCGFEIEGLAKVSINQDRCKGCGLCVWTCPYNVLETAETFNAHGYQPAFARNPGKCRGCTWCTLICPDAAIEIERGCKDGLQSIHERQ